MKDNVEKTDVLYEERQFCKFFAINLRYLLRFLHAN